MDETPVLVIENLAINYNTRKRVVNAVRDVSFTINHGESLGLVGETGCGKSTVAFSVVDFLGANGSIVRGSVRFKGQELRGRTPKELNRLRGADISMVYQEPMSSLNPSMRVVDQLAEALLAHQGVSKTTARKECYRVLEKLYMPDIEGVLDRYPHQLSGGQQQRVLIAMAMLNNPSLLIMDEPTTSLDVTVEAAVLDLLVKLREEFHTATLYISHNLGVVARIADKVAVMYAGEVIESAPTETIYNSPLHPYTMGLMRCLPNVDAARGTHLLHPIKGQVPALDQIPSGCIFSPRCEQAGKMCGSEHPELTEFEAGHFVRCTRRRTWSAPDLWSLEDYSSKATQPNVSSVEPYQMENKTILQATDLKVYYPVAEKAILGFMKKKQYLKAVDGVSLAVDKGTTIGIVGESGCGKSSLARAIVGLEPIRQGKIEFLGVDISRPIKKRSSNVIREIQMVFQNPDGVLNPSYTVGNQIAMSLQRFHIVPKRAIYDTVIQLLHAVKLGEEYSTRYPRQLSGGEKQRVGIARAIASNPNMLVCDEPVSALDVSVQASVLNLLLEIQEKNQTSIILISHDLSTVRFLSHYVMVMYLGQTVEEGPSESIYSPPSHPYTHALLAAVPRPDPTLVPSTFRLSGNLPSAVNPPVGCRFHTRCPLKIGTICEQTVPPAYTSGEGHHIYCHLPPEQLFQIDQYT